MIELIFTSREIAWESVGGEVESIGGGSSWLAEEVEPAGGGSRVGCAGKVESVGGGSIVPRPMNYSSLADVV